MKPHIFYDKGWKVGENDRARDAGYLIPDGFAATLEAERERREARLAIIRGQGGQKITGEDARNTAPFADPPPNRQDFAL